MKRLDGDEIFNLMIKSCVAKTAEINKYQLPFQPAKKKSMVLAESEALCLSDSIENHTPIISKITMILNRFYQS